MAIATNKLTFSSEAARERETFKYDALEISTAALHDPEAARPIPSAVLSSAPDPGLTAFAQLALYRLNGSRALVSLFDRKHQHIVAEALRSTPLNLTEEKPHMLWLCGTAVPRATSICEHVLAGPASAMTVPGNAAGNAAGDLPVSVVLDLDQDERFSDIQDPQKRFYIGVPIRSPAGINIGVYCVFDDKPRQQVSAEEIQFIRDMSRTVMDYLEAKRSHECYRREERMVRGLGSFVEGKATLSNWSQSSNPSSFQDLPGVQEGTLNKKLRSGSRRSSKADVNGLRTQNSAKPPPPRDTNAVATNHGHDTPAMPDPTTQRKGRMSSADDLQEDVESVCSKASNIIRESIEVEGVVFHDASVRTFGGLVGKDMSSPLVLGKPSSDESSSDEIPYSQSRDSAGATCCKVLGYSTSQSSSVNGDVVPSPLTGVPEKFLHWLLQRYPHGKIFCVEADTRPQLDYLYSDFSHPSRCRRDDADALGHSGTGGISATSERGKQRQSVASSLGTFFPGAKSVAFVPLWDSQRSRWFAGGFVWTRTPTRIFTSENELSYLKVYGLTIMAEVTRLYIRAADKTKMNVLSSISHELRSPLHGVVGAAELLRQTHLDSSQEKTLRTIQISSRTLLDTIDHLLDYGKINGLIKSNKLQRSGSATRLPNGTETAPAVPSSPEMSVHLDRLAEEVVDSVLAGYGYANMSDPRRMTWDSSLSNNRGAWRNSKDAATARARSPDNQHGAENVRIYLDIEPADSWSFRMLPGAFRRIVMNLFGNSLKFTEKGFIRVHLRRDAPSSQSGNQEAGLGKVLLTVSDSGKGISDDYLHNQLYTPFAQEDHFAPGTGLGLSLVRQVVTTLGGDMDIASQVGHGTAVTVSLPLPLGDEEDEEEASFKAMVQELAGLRVLIRGSRKPRATADAVGSHINGDRDGEAQSQLQLIEGICRGWLHMQVLSEPGNQDLAPHFVIIAEEAFTGLDGENGLDRPPCPHIIICRNPLAVLPMSNQRRMPACFELISQPVGPRKLVKSLFDNRQRWKASQHLLPKQSSATCLANQRPLLISTPFPSQAAQVTSVLTEVGTVAGRPGVAPALTLTPANTKQPAEFLGTEPQIRDMASGAVQYPSTPAASGLVTTSAPNRRTVLIVDDNPINRKILAAYMTKIDQPHSMATNGLEALEKYKESPSEYSCILTDISMPVMDGLESTRYIREFEHARQLGPCKIIALTSLSGTEVQQDAHASGVDMFLTRPVTLKSVISALEESGVR